MAKRELVVSDLAPAWPKYSLQDPSSGRRFHNDRVHLEREFLCHAGMVTRSTQRSDIPRVWAASPLIRNLHVCPDLHWIRASQRRASRPR